ncbi:MAG: Rrf2 family transcriptional regulator [Pirellulales bacterium]
MKLSRTITYAVQAALYLARAEPGVPVPCSQLAREGHLPERFLLQILRCLVIRGLLQSARGVDGGYFLSRPPDEITLGDIVESFDNPLETRLPMLEGMSPGVRSSILQTLQEIAHSARVELQRLTVADLLACQETVPIGNGRPATR